MWKTRATGVGPQTGYLHPLSPGLDKHAAPATRHQSGSTTTGPVPLARESLFPSTQSPSSSNLRAGGWKGSQTNGANCAAWWQRGSAESALIAAYTVLQITFGVGGGNRVPRWRSSWCWLAARKREGRWGRNRARSDLSG
jgi:hypothetical protein